MPVPLARRVADELLSWPGVVSVAHAEEGVVFQVGKVRLARMRCSGELLLNLTPREWAAWRDLVGGIAAPDAADQQVLELPLVQAPETARALELLRWMYRQRCLWP